MGAGLSRAAAFVLGLVAAQGIARAGAAERTATFRFVPTARAQIAIWIESADGSRFANVRLTEAVCIRGIGNRPGASQMNSGYRWPYGRREGVLPVWAHRRAAVPGATQFRRVIFQNRPEGYASRTTDDSSQEAYFCLPFAGLEGGRDDLDAVSCPSVFNGDKGRFIRESDVVAGYAEPFEEEGRGEMRPLELTSLYPPRIDLQGCAGAACRDSPDLAMFASEARRVLPELDTISMATPAAGIPVEVLFPIPAAWPDGDYVAFLEINTEGDYNATYAETVYPTPTLPSGAWDSWAMSYGYPFRGQPSVVFRLPIQVGADDIVWTRNAEGSGSLSGQGAQGGAIRPIDATITDDPAAAPGSGVDRLHVTPEGYRLRIEMARVARDAGPLDAPGADAGVDGPADAGVDEQADAPVDGRGDASSRLDGGMAADAAGDRSSDGCGCAFAVGEPEGRWLTILFLVSIAGTRRRASRLGAAGGLDQ